MRVNCATVISAMLLSATMSVSARPLDSFGLRAGGSAANCNSFSTVAMCQAAPGCGWCGNTSSAVSSQGVCRNTSTLAGTCCWAHYSTNGDSTACSQQASVCNGSTEVCISYEQLYTPPYSRPVRNGCVGSVCCPRDSPVTCGSSSCYLADTTCCGGNTPCYGNNSQCCSGFDSTSGGYYATCVPSGWTCCQTPDGTPYQCPGGTTCTENGNCVATCPKGEKICNENDPGSTTCCADDATCCLDVTTSKGYCCPKGHQCTNNQKFHNGCYPN